MRFMLLATHLGGNASRSRFSRSGPLGDGEPAVAERFALEETLRLEGAENQGRFLSCASRLRRAGIVI
jgi:hypothetical protein